MDLINVGCTGVFRDSAHLEDNRTKAHVLVDKLNNSGGCGDSATISCYIRVEYMFSVAYGVV